MKKLINKRNGIFAIFVALAMTVTYSEAQNPFLSEAQNPFFVAQTVPCHIVFELAGNKYDFCIDLPYPCEDQIFEGHKCYNGCPCPDGENICLDPYTN